MVIAASPNFFIIGAPKSGTTALYTYLRQHPDIFMPAVKEPKFFAADVCGHQRRTTTWAEYLALFQEARVSTIGEASTCYLCSQSAAYEIKKFCPDARIIALLRNPVDVMYAEHSERLFDGSEHIADFVMALDSQATRRWRSGRFRGEAVLRPSYRNLVEFSEQIKRYLDVFGREHVMVIIYDDLASNAELVYRRVLAFLGLSETPPCCFDVIHANRQVRSTLIQDLLRHPPGAIRKGAKTLFPISIRHRLGSYLNALNVRIVPRRPLQPLLRHRLQAEYEVELQNLSKVIDRDVTCWSADHHSPQ